MRPIDYVESYASAARPLIFSRGVGERIPAPDWWEAARAANAGVEAPDDIGQALAVLASMAEPTLESHRVDAEQPIAAACEEGTPVGRRRSARTDP